MLSQHLFYSYSQLKTLVHSFAVGKLLLRFAALVLGFFLISTYLSWASVFTLTWVIGGSALLGLQYFGVQGLLALLLSATVILWLKTSSLWLSALGSSCVWLYQLGDYAALSDNYVIQLQYCLDQYSLSYILLTNTIGCWALLFASNYMRGEPRVLNFVILLYFFLISMVLLLASGNFPTLMLGWELIGCFSFLLINFWTTRIGTAKSAFKAFFFNKLSDAALILSFLSLVYFLPSSLLLNFSNLYVLQGLPVHVFGITTNALILFLAGVIICSFCKSAQFGFHAWLPDSMEAPVPASALIHSATLVSAGIFLLGRHEVITSLEGVNSLLVVWCSLTALYGGVVAAYQTDLKKILAYSTISHCGFLFLLVTYNNFLGLVLYLHLHGWFKSYSFMASGNIISKYLGYQDYRRMGGGISYTTIEALVLIISISCLGGLPFLLGFFNKHYLLLLGFENVSYISTIFLLAAAFTGLFYTIKTVRSILFSQYKTTRNQANTLTNGLSTRVLVSSEPMSNIVLLGLYPLMIASFSIIVLSGNFWSEAIAYHSIFGVWFFYIYLVLVALYTKVAYVPTICSLLLVKLLYVI